MRKDEQGCSKNTPASGPSLKCLDERLFVDHPVASGWVYRKKRFDGVALLALFRGILYMLSSHNVKCLNEDIAADHRARQCRDYRDGDSAGSHRRWCVEDGVGEQLSASSNRSRALSEAVDLR